MKQHYIEEFIIMNMLIWTGFDYAHAYNELSLPELCVKSCDINVQTDL